MIKKYNKGEWSELYAFIKLLKEGKIYGADENADRIDDIYLPIIKIMREANSDSFDYFTGEKIRIYKNNCLIKEIDNSYFTEYISVLFGAIFEGSSVSSGAFAIPLIDPLLNDLNITKIKASSEKKADIQMQVHDIHTGYSQEVGFSIKSDIGSPPTLLNPSKITRFRFQIHGLDDSSVSIINSIDKKTEKNYVKQRMRILKKICKKITYDSMLSQTYEDNLILIDSLLPEIYGEMILQHYLHLDEGISNCTDILDLVCKINPLNYRQNSIYRYKFKKLITAAALGMTPSSQWDGLDAATGGYIIIKKDGDVVCYHLYNRNFFEEYLLNNTYFDRPSTHRYDYGYVYCCGDKKFIDLNVQIRFKSIK